MTELINHKAFYSTAPATPGLLKTLGHLKITIFKLNEKFIFLLFFYWPKCYKKFSSVIMYTFQSNLLSELILDLRRCPNQKTHESEIAGFLLWALPEVQNQIRKQIWLKNIPNYMTKFNFWVLWSIIKKVKKKINIPLYFKIVIWKWPKVS